MSNKRTRTRPRPATRRAVRSERFGAALFPAVCALVVGLGACATLEPRADSDADADADVSATDAEGSGDVADVFDADPSDSGGSGDAELDAPVDTPTDADADAVGDAPDVEVGDTADTPETSDADAAMDTPVDAPPVCDEPECTPEEFCVGGGHVEAAFCTSCDPDVCGLGANCCPGEPGATECTDLTQLENCGACGRACGEAQRCVVPAAPLGAPAFCSSCIPETCEAEGSACCEGAVFGCSDLQNDSQNCGGCGVRCSDATICLAGECQAAEFVDACEFDTQQFWAGEGVRDITFVAFADPQAADTSDDCAQSATYEADQNQQLALALRSILPGPGWETHLWPAGFAGAETAFEHVRGAIVTGDLTESGDESSPAGETTCNEYREFADAYGACGDEGRLPFPVYEGYGNRDFPRGTGAGDIDHHPVIDRVDARTTVGRPGAEGEVFDDPVEGTGHYAWRWDDIWFLQLNLKAGSSTESRTNVVGTRIADPHGALAFVQAFLAAQGDSATRRIVVAAHRGPQSERFDPAERAAFCALLSQAQLGEEPFTGQKLSGVLPVMAFVHGNDEETPASADWACPAPFETITMPTFTVGTPQYGLAENDGQVHFTVFRITAESLEALGVGAAADAPAGAWSTAFARLIPLPESAEPPPPDEPDTPPTP